VHDGEQRISSPLTTIGRAALWLTTTAPFIGEENLRPVIVEGRGMPVRKIRIGNRGDADGMRRVGDVEQESVAFAGSARATNRRVHSNVVALRWAGSIRTRRCRGDYSIDHRLQSGTQ